MPARRARPALIVLAAGQGTRFGGLKQMEPVGPGGESMLDYAVFDAIRAGFGSVVFVVGSAFADLFRERIAARYADRLTVRCVCQRLDDIPAGCTTPVGRHRPLGTLHAVWSARDEIDGPFAVINADDFYGSEAYARVAGFLAIPSAGGPSRCCMVAYPLQQTLSGSGGVNRGICVVQDGLLQGVVEHTDIRWQDGDRCSGVGPDGLRTPLDPQAVASMNIWGFQQDVLGPMGMFLAGFLDEYGGRPDAECYLPAFVGDAVAARTVQCAVLPTRGAWFGMTYPQDKSRCVDEIRALVDRGEYPHGPWLAA